jgi:ferredoxin
MRFRPATVRCIPITGRSRSSIPNIGHSRLPTTIAPRQSFAMSMGEVTLEAVATAEVELDGCRHQVRWPRQSTLVDVMLAAGIDVPHSCREGHCGSCVCTVVSGEVEMSPSDVLEPEDRHAGLILACQARPVSDKVQIEF